MSKLTKILYENYAYLPQRFINKIDSDLNYLLKSDIPGLKGIYLFGSCARGDLRSGSDIDLLILTDQKLNDRMLASNIRYTLEEKICGVGTDVVFMNEDSIIEHTVFKNLVNRDKILILEVKE